MIIQQPIFRYAFISVILGIILGYITYQEPTLLGDTPDDDLWSVSEWSPEQDALPGAYEWLQQRYISGNNTQRNDSAAEGDLVLNGVVLDDGIYYAIIKTEDGYSRYTNGDVLPDGSVIQDIGADSLTVNLDDGVVTIEMYK